MKTITLTADGERFTGPIPTHWGEVPFAPYALLVAATTVPERCDAVAALLGLPAAPFHEDVSLLGKVYEHLPLWLFQQLPKATEPVPHFTHLGTRYQHIGPLRKIKSGQFEALYTFNAASADKPLSAGPGLLAVLYCPVGKQQTPEVVRDAAAAFASLPMNIAWPALADFTRVSGPAALKTQTASALHAQVSNLLPELETTLATGGASTTCWQKVPRWLMKMWLRNARKMLMSS